MDKFINNILFFLSIKFYNKMMNLKKFKNIKVCVYIIKST